MCEGQGQSQGHHVKNVIFIYFAYFIWASRAKVTRVKGHIGQVQMRVPKKGRWAHINVKLLHLKQFLPFNDKGGVSFASY